MKELKYVKISDEEAVTEAEKRLNDIKKLLIEIRDLLKAAGTFE